MTTMYDVVLAFAGAPANDLESFVMRLAAIVLSVIFVYLILWLIIKVGEWVSRS